jgi:hypothetical protein
MTPFRLLFSPMDAAGRQSRNTPAACFSRRLPLSPRALPSIRAEMHDHVHVHASRQAVVDGGRPPGGEDQSKSEDQPDAKQIARVTGDGQPDLRHQRRRANVRLGSLSRLRYRCQIFFFPISSAIYSACRMARDTIVKVGFSAPPVVNWLPSEMNRFLTS